MDVCHKGNHRNQQGLSITVAGVVISFCPHKHGQNYMRKSALVRISTCFCTMELTAFSTDTICMAYTTMRKKFSQYGTNTTAITTILPQAKHLLNNCTPDATPC